MSLWKEKKNLGWWLTGEIHIDDKESKIYCLDLIRKSILPKFNEHIGALYKITNFLEIYFLLNQWITNIWCDF